MFNPIIANENGKARYNEMLETAEQYRQAQKFNQEKSGFSLPKLSNLFGRRQSKEETAVPVQAR